MEPYNPIEDVHAAHAEIRDREMHQQSKDNIPRRDYGCAAFWLCVTALSIWLAGLIGQTIYSLFH